MKLIIFLFLFVAGRAAAQTSLDNKVLTFLQQFRLEYKESMVRDKPDILSRYYSPNIRLMPEFQKTIIGKDNAILYHQLFSQRFDVQDYKRTEIEIHDLKSKVLEIGMLTMKMKSKEAIYELRGKYFNVWNKLANGTLSLETEAWNYDHSIDFGGQLRFKDVPVVDVAFTAHVPIKDNISFELAALNSLMESIVTFHDPLLWIQLYTDDGMFCYSNNTIKKGKKQLSEFLIEHCKDLPVFENLSIRNDRIDYLGDYVIEYASHIAVIRSEDFSGVFTGKDLAIWRREQDGSLKIFRQIAMYD